MKPDYVIWLFYAALFLSAALLFCVQPMLAKLLLPLLGGAPAVWTTCMVFFQTTLLAGYLYAHAATRWLHVRLQTLVHLAFLVASLVVLPMSVSQDANPSYETSPVSSLLWLLIRSVGLPFFTLSASAPLLQRWFSLIHHPRGKDPYFLYAASNLGSMLALVAYPLLLEPRISLGYQRWLWSIGVGLALVLFLPCALLVWRSSQLLFANPNIPTDAKDIESAEPLDKSQLTLRRRLRWIALASIPSSLLLGVTTYITTDLAPVPLFWVIPLTLYLASFILVFARNQPLSHARMVQRLPLVVTVAVGVYLSEALGIAWLPVLTHLAMFFVACMVCHGQLANDRPNPKHLTEFYLWMGVGGVLGGLFNGLVAPAIFPGMLEYPLAIVLVCACRPDPDKSRWQRADVIFPLVVGTLTVALILFAKTQDIQFRLRFLTAFALPLLINYATKKHVIRFALGIAAILVASRFYQGIAGSVILQERNFFGVLRITRDPISGRFHQMMHGNILHGRQNANPSRRREPLSYYHPSGPIGDVFAQLGPKVSRIGVIGLGTGAMACYAQPQQHWTFYEINPAVVQLAQDPTLFTYLEDSFPDPQKLTIVLGDARLRLRNAPKAYFDILVLDAFSSDTIPVHLLTRESLALYLDKLDNPGVLVMHISNQYLNLAPVVAALAVDAKLFAYVRDERQIAAELADMGKSSSTWVVLARQEANLLAIAANNPQWTPLEVTPHIQVWTDDFSNIFQVFRWQQP